MSSESPKTLSSEHADPENSEASTGQTKRPLVDSLRDGLALVSAGAGIFVVLLYLAGRSYASGYFGAMNIPAYMPSFSLWEYGEVGGIGLFLGALGFVAVLSLLSWLVFLLNSWLSAAHFGKKHEHKEKNKSIPSDSPKPNKNIWFSFRVFSFAMAGFGVFAIFAYILTWVVIPLGKRTGQNTVLETAAKVELVSTIPLSLDDNTLIPTKASGQDYYIYKGFHLLVFNDGKYYLFKEIDPFTCKPLKVYIINAEKDVQINLSAAESLSAQCQITNPPTVTPTPAKFQPTPTLIQITPTP